jgi:predicted DCC family thiol-disulfide oxidoreductase YuxK
MSKIILFDGDCNFCNYWVNFILKNDIDDKFLFASLQSEYGSKQLEKHKISNIAPDTFILIDNENYHIKSDAAFLILKDLKHWLKAFSFLKIIPKIVRDFIYDIIAQNRKKIFRTKSYCIIPSDKIRRKFLE